MHALILGAAGMIGRRLVDALVKDGRVGGEPLTALTLLDVVPPSAPEGFSGPVRAEAADLTAPGAAEAAIAERPGVIFHLAAVVSGEAEANLELGYRVNLDGTRLLLEAIRKANAADGYRPKLVFTSSLAVFGPLFPKVIPDDHILRPASSYGVQKAMGELMLADYARRMALSDEDARSALPSSKPFFKRRIFLCRRALSASRAKLLGESYDHRDEHETHRGEENATMEAVIQQPREEYRPHQPTNIEARRDDAEYTALGAGRRGCPHEHVA